MGQTIRRPRGARRKLILKSVANHVLEAAPQTIRLTPEALEQMTLVARAYWETTQWAEEYPGIIPLITHNEESGRVEVAFCERPDEDDLTDYTDGIEE